MPYLPLCALEGFSKNQPQHLIWMGICRQMTSLNTKSRGRIANKLSPRTYSCTLPSLQVFPRGANKCTLGRQQNTSTYSTDKVFSTI